MDYIMVTFKTSSMCIDLKIPAYATVGELIQMISSALDLCVGSQNRIQAEPLGRILDNGLSLAQEGVMNGALLTLI